MLKQIMLNKQIEQYRNQLKELEPKEEDFKTRSSELERAIDEAETDEEIEAVDSEVESLQEEKEELKKEKEKLEEKVAELEAELAELNENKPEEDERGKGAIKNMEQREGLVDYVRTKGATRAGFTSVEGGALVPEELLKPEEAAEDDLDLTKVVNVVKVNSGAGKYPHIKKSDSKMTSVTELAENPELAKPTITDVKFDIETYRGYIPVSKEVIEDSDYDVAGLIADEISDQELNTKNAEIATVLKTANAKEVTGVDGLKSVFNVDLKKTYKAKAILSASLFNELDTTKDKNGRYLLQDDIRAESGKKLFGKEVIVLDDDVIGTTDGDLVGFVGDSKAFTTLFDRKRASVKWTDNDVYGELLAGFVRFDVKVADTDAGFYVTYTAEV